MKLTSETWRSAIRTSNRCGLCDPKDKKEWLQPDLKESNSISPYEDFREGSNPGSEECRRRACEDEIIYFHLGMQCHHVLPGASTTLRLGNVCN